MTHPGFRIAAAYAYAEAHGLADEAAKIRSMPIHPSIPKPSAVRKGCLVDLFEKNGVIDDFVAKLWPLRNTPTGDNRYKHFMQRKALNERRLNGEPVPPGVEPPTEEPDSDDPTAFALEAHLRDYIAANLSKISINSSKVDLYKDSTGRSGVEYPTGVGPIDILGVDSGGSFYVFELKVGRGPDKALGQLARYMGWVKINLAKGKDVVGVIVANSIDQKLRYAAHVFPGVTLLEYELAFSIRGVAAMSTPDVPDKGASSQL